MAGSRTTTRKTQKRPAKGASKRKPARRAPTLAERFAVPRIPQLDQNQRDILGLAIVAAAAFFSFVFYFGWDGGKVGGAIADGFFFLFGNAAYLVPVVMFGLGTLTVMKPLLPTVRPFKSGTLCLLT